jgi:hypothetical protein
MAPVATGARPAKIGNRLKNYPESGIARYALLSSLCKVLVTILIVLLSLLQKFFVAAPALSLRGFFIYGRLRRFQHGGNREMECTEEFLRGLLNS